MSATARIQSLERSNEGRSLDFLEFLAGQAGEIGRLAAPDDLGRQGAEDTSILFPERFLFGTCRILDVVEFLLIGLHVVE